MSGPERWIVANPRTTAIIVAVALVGWFASFYRYEIRGTANNTVYLDRWTGAIYTLKGQCVNCDARP